MRYASPAPFCFSCGRSSTSVEVRGGKFVSVGSSTVQTVAEAHAHLRARTDIQFDLPGVPPPQPPPPWVKWLQEALHGVAPFGAWIFWGIVIAGVCVILWLVVTGFAGRRRSRDVSVEPEREIAAWRPEAKVARALLAEADALAAAGRFDEAAHLLLHRSLEDIQRRRPKLLRPALTSREIMRVPALPELVRGAFAAMAAAVERSLFGGRGLERRDWETARAAYSEFAIEQNWK